MVFCNWPSIKGLRKEGGERSVSFLITLEIKVVIQFLVYQKKGV